MVLRRFIFNQGLSIAYFLVIIFTMSQAKSAKNSQVSLSLTDVSHSEGSACHNFSVGDPLKKELFSPNYPNLYPKSTQCAHRITAPSGHTVMLDFRDKFHLENSANCDFDKLEVRDGAYGYSPLLGTFCGNDFPTKLYSSKRYMWLQFTSDDSIEYEGFRAVYDFIPMPNHGKDNHENDKECSFIKSGSSGYIKKIEINEYFTKYNKEDTVECMWTIEAEAGKKIYMNFNEYKLAKPNDCDMNFIEIFDDGRTPDKRLSTFCGTTAEPQKTKSNITHIRLFTHKSAFENTDFVIHFTTFREFQSSKNKEEMCNPATEFNCGDQTCVDIALKCDGEFDCKYRYDEDSSICLKALGAGMVLTSEHMIIILVVFFSLVIAMCASISISCYNKIKERQVREREYKERRSKEASVEATLDRNLRGHSSPDRASDIQKRTIPQVASATNFEQPGSRAAGIRDFADDEESSDGCYVPEVDLSVFKHPNGGETIPKKPRPPGLQQQQYPYISESFESLESDVIVPPAPPPVPLHMKDRRDISPPPPTYRIVGGKVVANPAKNEPYLERMQKQPLESSRSTLDSKGGSSYGRFQPESRPSSTKPISGPSPYPGYKPVEKPETQMKPEKDISGPIDKTSWLRGPLEAGAPRTAFSRSPGEIGLPKFGMARVTPDGPRGPLASSKTTPLTEKGVPLATFRSPYEDTPSYGRGYRPPAIRNYAARNNPQGESLKTQASIESSDKDSIRAHSAASTLSAPDVIAKR